MTSPLSSHARNLVLSVVVSPLLALAPACLAATGWTEVSIEVPVVHEGEGTKSPDLPEVPDLAPELRTLQASAGGVFSRHSLYVEADGNASRQANLWRSSDPAGAAVMDQLAQLPVATWLTRTEVDVTTEVRDAVTRAGQQLQVFVVYNIPNRDCGAWSSGGAPDRGAYTDYVNRIAQGLDGRLAIVILEPDGLAHQTCLDDQGRQERHEMMSEAVDTLTVAGAEVYLDAGDSNWIPADEMAESLIEAGVERAAGFALNVSHTEHTEDEIGYAEELRALIGTDPHYVIDTSRNGLGPTHDNQWCNPLGRANGASPTLQVGEGALDALLWIKPPGESDGSCNGGPQAGAWWPEYARDLAVLAGF